MRRNVRAVALDDQHNNIYVNDARRILLDRQNWICPLCGKTVSDNKSANIDHIIPKSLGGSNHIDNLQLTHVVCNRRKGVSMSWKLAMKEKVSV